MAQFRDEGVVLRTYRLGEADRIIVIMTSAHGKVRAVAKGVRKTTSKFGSRLEPLTHVSLMLWRGRSDLDIVNQAVEAAKKQLNTKPQAAFLNAVLRRFLREKDALMKQALDTELGRYNHQAWWVAKLKKQYPQDWQDLLERAQTPPPMMLRVNTRLSTRAAYQATLEAQGLHAHTIAGTDQGLVLTQASRVEALPGFREGFCSVQDGHAQWAARRTRRRANRSPTGQGSW